MRLLATLLLGLTAATPAPAGTYVYVAVAGDRKIAAYQIRPADGRLIHRTDTALEGEPGALTVDPRHRFLFAALRSTGQLAAFRIDPKTARLARLNTVRAGPDPAQLCVDHAGRFLLCADYVAGQVTAHAIGRDGSLSREPTQTVKTADKAHAVLLDRDGRFAFVPHTGPNAVYQFTYAAASGRLRPAAVPVLRTPPGTGPRHGVFHPTLGLAYLDNEQGGSVTAYRLDRAAQTLRPVQTLGTLPAGFRGTNACSEVRLHPSGKFLYVANRGHDSIARFAVRPADGRLTALGQTPTEPTPRSFDLDPAGRFLYAAGESSGKLAAYRIDGASGDLRREATYEVGRRPWWVMAVQVPGR
jgi:6-phosphogluconolactonase